MLWAFVMLFLSKRAIHILIPVLIIMAPTARLVSEHLCTGPIRIITPACFDALGLGALLAISRDRGFGFTQQRFTYPQVALWVGCPVYLLLNVVRWKGGFLGISPSLAWSLHPTFAALFFVWIIDRAAKGFTGPVKIVLESTMVTYIGVISYGIYVLHTFVPPMMRMVVEWMGLSASMGHLTYWFWIKLVATVGLASLSWHYIERPILRLKRIFPYRPVPALR